METDKTPEATLIGLPNFVCARSQLCITAKCAPMELNTWMLGQRLVGVSVFQSMETSQVKQLSLGMETGLKSCPFGHRVEIIKNMVMPVNRKAQAL